MLYKMFCFFGKHLKTVKLSFTRYFPEALFAYFALKVSKTFHNFLLALKVYKNFSYISCLLACFTLLQKFIKLFINLLLACFTLLQKFIKTFHKSLALKVYKTFYKHRSQG